MFTSDWDFFPRLFHFNHHNTYLAGLDPYFLYAADKNGFLIWQDMTQGRLKGPVANIIEKRFGAKYILVDSQHKKMQGLVEKDPAISRVFSDTYSKIYQIKSKQN